MATASGKALSRPFFLAPILARSLALALVLLWGGWLCWLLAHPARLTSDDALYFRNGLLHYSILEFSPHFPGYPAFIVAGRLLLAGLEMTGGGPQGTDTASLALFLTSVLSVAALPPALALAGWRQGGWTGGMLAGGLGLACPLLPGVALSMLSDGSGCLLMVLAVAVLPGRKPAAAGNLEQGLAGSPGMGLAGRHLVACGALLGAAFLCRPSLAPFLAGMVGGLLPVLPASRRWHQGGQILLAGAAVVLPACAVLLAIEGWPLVEEGARFVSGHNTLWGNTVLRQAPSGASAGTEAPGLALFQPAGRQGWLDSLWQQPAGGAWLLLLAALLVPVPARVFIVRGWLRLAAGRRDGAGAVPSPPVGGLWAGSFLAGGLLAGSLLAGGLLAGGLWTLFLQNPDNLRHLLPVLLLLFLLLALPFPARGLVILHGTARLLAVVACLALWAGGAVILSPGQLPPVARAAERIRVEDPPLLLTNLSIALLRREFPSLRVIDRYYGADAASLIRQEPRGGLWLSGRQETGHLVLLDVYRGRAPGEGTLYLYRLLPLASAGDSRGLPVMLP